jgi:hypothetical protein
MAMVGHVPAAKTQQASPLRLVEFRMPGKMASGREVVEETVARVIEVIEEKIFVAVGKSVKECKSMLFWALQNSGGKRICIIHVHQPAQMIPFSKFTKMKRKRIWCVNFCEFGFCFSLIIG